MALLMSSLVLASCGGDASEDPESLSTPSETGGDASQSDPASPGSDATEGDLDSLIAEAQAEGSLTWYSVPDESDARALSDAFQEKYGIEVSFVRLASSDLATRYSSEIEAGAPAADLVLVSNTPFVDQALSEGWFTPLSGAGLPSWPGEFPEEFVVRDGATAVVSLNPTGIGYNTDLVASDEVPSEWTDLLDPRWEGEILIADPTSSPAYALFWDVIMEEYGEDYISDLAAQDLTFYSGGGAPVAAALGAGEGAIAIPSVAALVDGAKAQGAPVEFVVPEVTSGPEIVVGLSAEAANPAAARLFAHFALSEEGAGLINGAAGAVSPYSGSEVPSGYVTATMESIGNAEKIYELFGVGG